MFNYLKAKIQKCVSQQVKTHKHRGVASLKIIVNRATKADSEAVRLAKTELQRTYLKDFDYDVSKIVEKVRELVETLEANVTSSASHDDEVITV